MRTPTATGRLLDKVAYCMRQPCKATNIVDEPITVRDTFPYNPDSKTAPETARHWAGGYNWEQTTYKPEIILRDNDPFTITITDLHVRSEGGRAYKVVDNDMRRFDLREDQILEVMKLVGILPRGGVASTFVWGILGSQVRLVLVGGQLHKAMIEGANDKKAHELAQAAGLHPTESSLVPGHIYRKKDKSLHLFLGRVKRPGSDKVQYAVIQMPVVEERAPNDIDNYAGSSSHNEKWVNARRLENELYARWDSLTWRERCEHEWLTKWMAYRQPGEDKYGMYPTIIFMSSPKFDADVGEIEPDMFDEIKKNENHQHGYTDAKLSSFVDEAFHKKYSGGYRAVGDSWYMYSASASVQKLVNEEYKKARVEFREGLEWK